MWCARGSPARRRFFRAQTPLTHIPLPAAPPHHHMELRTVATGDAHDHEDAPLLMGERAAARPRAAPQTLNVVAMGRVAAVALTVATISALLTVVLPASLSSGPGGATGDQPVARHHGGTMATSLFSGNKVRQYTGRRLFSGADQFKVRFVVVLSRAGDSAHHPRSRPKALL